MSLFVPTKFLYSPKHFGPGWDLTSLLLREYLRFFPMGVSGRNMILNTHFHLLRTSGVIPPLLHISLHGVHSDNIACYFDWHMRSRFAGYRRHSFQSDPSRFWSKARISGAIIFSFAQCSCCNKTVCGHKAPLRVPLTFILHFDAVWWTHPKERR